MDKKRRKGKTIKIVLLSLLAILIIIGIIVFNFINSDIKGTRGGSDEVNITIEQGMGPLAIGNVLQEKGLIRSAQLFRFYAKSKGETQNLQYGDFTLNQTMSYDEIIETLKSVKANRASVRVTFPEGSTLIQMANKMQEAGLCNAEDFIKSANEDDFSQFKFFAHIGDNPLRFMRAEGYLFPETYDFYKDDTVYNMVAKMYQHFDSLITDEMYARMDEMGYKLDELITIASFVQEEAGHAENQADVAAVLINRLKEGSPVPRLECNVSSYVKEAGNYVNDYIIPYYGGASYAPEGMVDAYDTYKTIGIPPSPISNSGIDAINNTLHYTENSPYYFFGTDKTGKYYYAVTANEHESNMRTARKIDASLK